MAQKLGRRWIGCDINKGAIQTTAKRLQAVMAEQIAGAEMAGQNARQTTLLETEPADADETPKPAQLSFGV